MTTFNLNGRTVSVDTPSDAPLLWVIRDELGFTGTKFGCGVGMCGACTVHVEGRATRSCITAVGAVAGAKVTTIEGLDPEGRHPLQQHGSSCRYRSAERFGPRSRQNRDAQLSARWRIRSSPGRRLCRAGRACEPRDRRQAGEDGLYAIR